MVSVASHQPNLLPWIGFWNKMSCADVFVLSCGVSFSEKDLLHRVKLCDGSMFTVPIARESKKTGTPICEVRIGAEADGKAMAERLVRTYTKFPFRYEERLQVIANLVEENVQPGRRIMDVTIATMKAVAEMLQVPWCKVVVDYETPRHDLSKTRRLIERMKAAQPSGPIRYLAGQGARNYMNPEEFDGYIGDLKYQVMPISLDTPDASILWLLLSQDRPHEFLGGWCEWETP